jgi:hypothetical protein
MIAAEIVHAQGYFNGDFEISHAGVDIAHG